MKHIKSGMVKNIKKWILMQNTRDHILRLKL